MLNVFKYSTSNASSLDVKLAEGKNIKASVYVKNTTASDKDLYIAIAQYNGNKLEAVTLKPYKLICLLGVVDLQRPDDLVVLLHLEHRLLRVVAHPDAYASQYKEIEYVRQQPVDPKSCQEVSSSQGDEEFLYCMNYPIHPFQLF